MAERMTQYKYFWAWEFDKEERWLNEMASNGWALVQVGFCKYTFERCEPNEYSIRLEMRTHDDSYISFLEETGAEYIGRFFVWQFFRKKSEYGQFDLFSDIDSKLSHLGRIHKTLLIIGILNFASGMLNVFEGVHSSANSFVAILNLLLATTLMYGVGRIKGKMEYLENERQLRE